MSVPATNKITRPVVLEIIGEDGKGRKIARCRCRCGVIIVRPHYAVTKGNTTSCGCYRRQRIREVCVTHGGSKQSEYRVWANMHDRCLNPNNTGYHKYGGRGISIDPRWINSFATFLADVGPRSGPEYSIDRRDNNGPYSPENCYWATKSQQARNRRSSVFVTIHGVRMLLIEACEKYNINYTKAHLRLTRHGWSDERALEVENGKA